MLNAENIELLIIHCSDTPDTNDIGASQIHKMHLSFGWEGIGYHKIIKRSGQVENGRPEFWVGAHVKGLNHKSLGVCLIGRKNFTKNQFASLKIILENWKKQYPLAHILGHCDSTKTDKTCPNFDVQEWYEKEKLNE